MTDPAGIAAGMTKAQRSALLTLPLPRDAQPHRFLSACTYGSIWRKSSKHYDALLDLEQRGIVEQRTSRGEVLWRPTRPLGLAVRAALHDDTVRGEGA